MRRLTGLLVAMAGAVSLLPAAAHGTPPQVTANFIMTAFHKYKVGDGWLAAVACRTVALPSDPHVVVLTTEVTCSVNDLTRTETMNGPVAVSVVAGETSPSFRFCVSGAATFLDTATSDVFTVPAAPTCITFEG